MPTANVRLGRFSGRRRQDAHPRSVQVVARHLGLPAGRVGWVRGARRPARPTGLSRTAWTPADFGLLDGYHSAVARRSACAEVVPHEVP